MLDAWNWLLNFGKSKAKLQIYRLAAVEKILDGHRSRGTHDAASLKDDLTISVTYVLASGDASCEKEETSLLHKALTAVSLN
jgi:hypothetical protein